MPRNIPSRPINRLQRRPKSAQCQWPLPVVGDDVLVDRVTHFQQLEIVDVVGLQGFIPNLERQDAI